MRIEDKNEKDEGYLVIESKEDLDEFMNMVIEAYYKLNPDRKRRKTKSPTPEERGKAEPENTEE